MGGIVKFVPNSLDDNKSMSVLFERLAYNFNNQIQKLISRLDSRTLNAVDVLDLLHFSNNIKNAC